MELTFAQQSTAFLYSLLLGVIIAAAYGFLRLLRRCLKISGAALFMLDLCFMLSCSIVIFYFSLAFLYGTVRFYVFLGCGVGFALYRLTLGRLTYAFFSPIICLIRDKVIKIRFLLKKILKKLLKTYNFLLYNKHKKKSDLSDTSDRKTDGKRRIVDNNEKPKGRGFKCKKRSEGSERA